MPGKWRGRRGAHEDSRHLSHPPLMAHAVDHHELIRSGLRLERLTVLAICQQHSVTAQLRKYLGDRQDHLVAVRGLDQDIGRAERTRQRRTRLRIARTHTGLLKQTVEQHSIVFGLLVGVRNGGLDFRAGQLREFGRRDRPCLTLESTHNQYAGSANPGGRLRRILVSPGPRHRTANRCQPHTNAHPMLDDTRSNQVRRH